MVPESIARIAVQQARVSGNGIFFFVRRFTSGQYAVVRLRLTGDSASNPVVFTDIRLAFEHGAGSQSIGFFKRGQPLPQPSATLRYRGAGIIRARWEVVVPGEELPNALDLRSEASLTPQDRVRQHRYRVLSRVQVFLPPNGGGVLRGPDPKLLPNEQYGQYLLLLRIESTDSMAGTPSGMAPFALPVLRYFIGESNGPPATDAGVPDDVALLAPSATVAASRAAPAVFEWREMREAALYRLEIGLRGRGIFSARVLPDPQAESNQYTAPPFIVTGLPERGVRWRVLAFAADGRLVGHSPWRDWFLQPSTEPESNSTQPRRGAFLGFPALTKETP